MSTTIPPISMKGTVSTGSVVGTITDTSSTWVGNPNSWSITISVSPITTSYPGTRGDFSYDGRDITVGDWVADASGAALKITSITSSSSMSVVAVAEDIDLYNTNSDNSGSGNGGLADGNCFIFGDHSGLAVITPYVAGYFSDTFSENIFSRFNYTVNLAQGGGGGGGTTVSASSIAAYTPKVTGSINSESGKKIYAALNFINTSTLTFAAGTQIDWYPATPTSSGSNTSVTPPVSIDPIGPVMGGSSTTASLTFNGTVVDTMTGNGTGSANKLTISDADDTSMVIDADNLSLQLGLNNISIGLSTGSSSKTEYVIQEDITGITPTITTTVVVDPTKSSTAPTQTDPTIFTPNTTYDVTYSSGIPHYTGESTSLQYNAMVSGAVTNVYLEDMITLQSYPGETFVPVVMAPGTNGILAVPQNNTPISLSGTITLFDQTTETKDKDGNITSPSIPLPVYTSAQLAANIHTPQGYKLASDPTGTRINAIMSNGTYIADMIDENNVLTDPDLGIIVSSVLPNGFRIGTTGSDNPDDDFTKLIARNWESKAITNSWEGSVRGGQIYCDTTNYSSGYVPDGPDYSKKDASQYVTFGIMRSAITNFVKSLKGTYSGLWVKLPGVTDSSTTLVNGWMDGMTSYQGWGVPGFNNAKGCALTAGTGKDQDISITFGTQSSSNVVNNLILVRFKLNSGDVITSLEFKGVN